MKKYISLLILIFILCFPKINFSNKVDSDVAEEIISLYDNQEFYRKNGIEINKIIQEKRTIYFIDEVFLTSINDKNIKEIEKYYNFDKNTSVMEKKMLFLEDTLENIIDAKILQEVSKIKRNNEAKNIIGEIEEMFKGKNTNMEDILNLYYIGSAIDILYPKVKEKYVENLNESSHLQVSLFLGSNMDIYYHNLREYELQNMSNFYQYNKTQKMELDKMIYNVKVDLIYQVLINKGISIKK